MRNVLLGKTGLRVSQLALGTGLFGISRGRGVDSAEVGRILDGYTEAGGNFIDTSDAYQAGQAEIVIGRCLKSRRNDYVIASKYTRGTGQSVAIAGIGNHRKSMSQAVEASLHRLQTDHIDIYFAHLDDGVTPIGEIARGFEDLIRAGKITYGGLSNFPAWRAAAATSLADLRGWDSISAIQVEYSLLQRDAERELLPMAEYFSLGVMGYSPLAGGLLTGKYRQGGVGRASGADGEPPALDRQKNEVIDVLIAISVDLGIQPSDVATAWVLSRGVIPILGVNSRLQLDSNLGAQKVDLGADHLRSLDAVSATPAGYPHDLLRAHRPAIFGS